MPIKKSSSLDGPRRKIDQSVDQTYGDLKGRFALVAKVRANIWFTTALTLFAIGFIIGIVYLADPEAFPRLQGSFSQAALSLRGNPTSSTVTGFSLTPTSGGTISTNTPPPGGTATTNCARSQLSVNVSPVSKSTQAGQAASFAVQITNNDRNCPAGVFKLRTNGSKTYGAKGTVTTGTGSVSIASGATGNVNISATPSSDASGAFVINVNVDHPISTGYNNSNSSNLLIGSGCVIAQPRVTISQTTSFTQYTYTVVNGDASSCPQSNFTVTQAGNFPGNTFSPASFSLAPGASQQGTVSIPSTSKQPSVTILARNTTTGQSWSASVSVGSSSGTGIPGSSCAARPTVKVSPEQALNSGNFTLTVTNNDASSCGTGNFGITGRPNESVDLGPWRMTPTTGTLSLAPGQTKSMSFAVTATGAASGTYNYGFSVSHPNDPGKIFTNNAYARFCVTACSPGTTNTGGNTDTPPSGSSISLCLRSDPDSSCNSSSITLGTGTNGLIGAEWQSSITSSTCAAYYNNSELKSGLPGSGSDILQTTASGSMQIKCGSSVSNSVTVTYPAAKQSFINKVFHFFRR